MKPSNHILQYIHRISIIVIFCCSIQISFAQPESLSNLRTKTISLTADIDNIQLDSLSIVYNSVNFLTDVDERLFRIDYENSRLIELEATNYDEVTIQYRVLPILFVEEEQGVEVVEFSQQDSIEYETFIIQQAVEETDLFDFGRLEIQGGLNRSLNFGNAQNLVVNSNLDLRLAGELESGIQVVGVLTDSNLPFQPQGNSRQIRELDKVFLQFKKDEHQITLGDYEQRKPNSYFLNYNKRLQGVNYSGDFLPDKEWKANAVVNGAVSRGKYTQNEFMGQEGNQGPYKLFGATNETFIIILAGTERVFVNGVQMERGQDRDYIIDYNVGEITFTNRQFITNRSRISVEFEYTNQTYTSTFLNTEANYGNETLNFRVNLYTEQDNKRNANLLDTTINTGNLFDHLGDDVSNFFINSYRAAEFNENRNQYRLVEDTLINNVLRDTVFVYSTSETEQLYNVIFTFVGEGEGEYRLENQLVNGRVFQFDEFGGYVAKLRVIPPQAQQLVALTTEFKPRENQFLQLETSLSNRDLNTLSTIGNDDNTGFAARAAWQSNYHFGEDSLKHRLATEVNYEFKGNQFRPIERYRPVEFTRDWNLSEQTDSLTEHYGNILLNYQPTEKQTIQYRFSSFLQDTSYHGYKNFGLYQFENNGVKLFAKLDYLTAKEGEIDSEFFRPEFLASKQIHSLNGLTIGLQGEQNERTFTNRATELLTGQSISDADVKVFIESQDTSKIYSKIALGKHYDKTPIADELVDLFEANVIEATGRINGSKVHKLNWNVTLRDLVVKDTSITQDRDKLSFLGKLNYNANILNGVIKTGFDYEIGAGQEPKREFSFVKVSAGEGQYTWNDYNNNGIQEIAEFEVAPFSDLAEYVRVFTSSNEYVNANSNQFNQYLNIEPALIWRNEAGVKKFLGRLSANSRLTLNRRVFEDSNNDKFNPYVFNVDSEGLLTASNRLTNRIIYNKLSNQFRVTYTQNSTGAKSLLLSGFEDRTIDNHSLLTDVFLRNKMNIQTELSVGNQSFHSENYAQKNFDFNQYSIKPKFGWVVNNSLRFGVSYNYYRAENLANLGGEKTTNNALNFDFAWNKKQQFSLNGKLDYNAIQFNGVENNAVQFSMLNGLQTGNNMIWNLNFEREIMNAVTVNLIYDGRKLGESTPVHTGRARFTATFN